VTSVCGLLRKSGGKMHGKCRQRPRRRNSTAVDLDSLQWTGAGDGNRTHVSSLGSCSSTIELHPPDRDSPSDTFRVTGIVPPPAGLDNCGLSSDRLPAGSLPRSRGGAIVSSLCGPLQTAFRFLRHPLPSLWPPQPLRIMSSRFTNLRIQAGFTASETHCLRVMGRLRAFHGPRWGFFRGADKGLMPCVLYIPSVL
jgi:hypothetical protein